MENVYCSAEFGSVSMRNGYEVMLKFLARGLVVMGFVFHVRRIQFAYT